MDAKHALVWTCALVVLAGCVTGTWQSPAVRQAEPPPPEPQEPPQVVSNEQTSVCDESAGIQPEVMDFIRRIDEAGNRREQRPARPSSGEEDIQHAAHTQPPPDAPTAEAAPADVVTDAPSPAPPPTPTPPAQESVASQPAPLEPPILSEISVRAAGGHAFRPTETDAPTINAPAAARHVPASLREFLEQTLPPEEGSFRDQLDLRMMWVIAGEYEKAREPLKLVTAEQQELASRFIEAWIAIREGHMGDLASAAQAATQELARLQEALRRLSDLSMPVLRICTAVHGFGQYDELDPARFLAGTASEFVIYCEVRNFVSERRPDGFYWTTFDMTTTLLNRAGDTVLEIKDPDITDRCRNRRHDCFIPRLVRLPASLSPGQYVAKVTIVDKLGQKVAQNRATFQLVARP